MPDVNAYRVEQSNLSRAHGRNSSSPNPSAGPHQSAAIIGKPLNLLISDFFLKQWCSLPSTIHLLSFHLRFCFSPRSLGLRRNQLNTFDFSFAPFTYFFHQSALLVTRRKFCSLSFLSPHIFISCVELRHKVQVPPGSVMVPLPPHFH